jgi:phenylacetate-coenzyme A ligase PaaK-like adenylate-forming protein
MPRVKIGDLIHVARLRRTLLRRDRWSRERLLEHQSRELAALREFASLKSPFYFRFHEGLADHPLEELPVLTKQEVMQSFDEIVTDSSIRLAALERHVAQAHAAARFGGRYVVSASSGDTGRRGLFVFSPDEWVATLASYHRPLWWAGLNPNLSQIFDPVRSVIYTSPVPWHQAAQVREAARSRLMPSLHIDATRPAAEVVDELNEWQPQYVGTHASLARALAHEQLHGRLRITPAVVAVGGEVLTAEARREIEAAWGTVLFDTYRASETGVLAAECPEHRGLHLCEDLHVIEVVDAQGRPVPPGEFGERVLVTTLYRRTQPLIRYELGDRVRLSPRACPCGRPFRLIDAVQGRVDMIPRGATGKEAPVRPVALEEKTE